MVALKFLVIVRLLLVISPRHEMNMAHTKSRNLKRYDYRICGRQTPGGGIELKWTSIQQHFLGGIYIYIYCY